MGETKLVNLGCPNCAGGAAKFHESAGAPAEAKLAENRAIVDS